MQTIADDPQVNVRYLQNKMIKIKRVNVQCNRTLEIIFENTRTAEGLYIQSGEQL